MCYRYTKPYECAGRIARQHVLQRVPRARCLLKRLLAFADRGKRTAQTRMHESPSHASERKTARSSGSISKVFFAISSADFFVSTPTSCKGPPLRNFPPLYG